MIVILGIGGTELLMDICRNFWIFLIAGINYLLAQHSVFLNKANAPEKVSYTQSQYFVFSRIITYFNSLTKILFALGHYNFFY